MLHGLLDVTLQSTRHKVILHGLQEMMSERQVILRDPSVTSMVLMVENGRKCEIHIYYTIIYANNFCDAGQVPISRYFTACCSITLHVHLNISQYLYSVSSFQGMYFVSSVLLIRMNMPLEYR